jgi:hypothetical protein
VSAPHVCTSCGRACRPCAEAAVAGRLPPHTVRVPWCDWCASIYVDNAPDPATGRVMCQGCDRPLPGLARLIERRLAKYPLLCGECKTDAHRTDGDMDPRGPAPVPPVERAPRPPLDPGPDPATPGQRWYRGGFRPRPPGPDTHTSELADEHTEWPGPGRTTTHRSR